MSERDWRDEGADVRSRAAEFVWERARALCLSRQRFLAPAREPEAERVPWFRMPPGAADCAAAPSRVKPTPGAWFVDHGMDQEMRWEAMAGRGYLVPQELFYVRSHSPTPRLDPARWGLRVEGTGVARPLQLGYDDLLRLPSVSVIRALECAGNGRRLFAAAAGRPIRGTQWGLGAIGVAEWTGVPLREVLGRAGLKPTARDVLAEGLDEARLARPIPVAKALADDTLLVYGMNGQLLPPDHGFPLRLLVPGWAAIASVKWVGRIEVSEQPLYTRWNTEEYILLGEGYSPQGPAAGPMVTAMTVKSAFELAWGARLPVGRQRLRGRAWSASGRIARVEVSVDGGRAWSPARLREPNLPHAWVCWEWDWEARAGRHALRARATDSRGNTQPESIPFNEKGYLYGAVAAHPVEVGE
jgi:DMSO/TMAO reductase YedYZ molybdopterin-dependent catalytic subunit